MADLLAFSRLNSLAVDGSLADQFTLAGQFIGEGAALLAAFLWAAATLMFGRLGKQLSPLVLNIVKGVFAIAMMVITLVTQYLIQHFIQHPPSITSETATTLPTFSITLLIVSGALGIGLGDTAYFSAINALGARKALLLETLAPPMATILAWIFLSERLSLAAISGIALTLTGVAWVISERVPGTAIKQTNAGLKIALLATFCQAAGAVLSRAALAQTTVSPLWSSLIRLSAGLVFMALLTVLRPQYLQPTAKPAVDHATTIQAIVTQWKQAIVPLKSFRLLLAVAIASFFATYLGIWLQQIALKNTAAGIAQALLATSPLFVIPMVAILGDRISWRSVGGVVIALSGVWLLLGNA
ncbi:MAG: DMT family transporter [Cyanobacteria bacterium J06621_11]